MAKKKAAKKKAAKKTKSRLKTPIHTTVKAPKTAYDINAIIAQMQKDRETREITTKKKLKEIAEELFLLGVKKATLSYDGSGDSGDIQWLDYEKLNDKVTVPQELSEKLKNSVWNLLPSGFENNDGGFGDVIIETGSRKVRVEHHQRITETHDSEEEFELV